MNLQIINGYAGTNPGLPTAFANPGRRYYMNKKIISSLIKVLRRKAVSYWKKCRKLFTTINPSIMLS